MKLILLMIKPCAMIYMYMIKYDDRLLYSSSCISQFRKIKVRLKRKTHNGIIIHVCNENNLCKEGILLKFDMIILKTEHLMAYIRRTMYES